jgi:hypothetical protein
VSARDGAGRIDTSTATRRGGANKNRTCDLILIRDAL